MYIENKKEVDTMMHIHFDDFMNILGYKLSSKTIIRGNEKIVRVYMNCNVCTYYYFQNDRLVKISLGNQYMER